MLKLKNRILEISKERLKKIISESSSFRGVFKKLGFKYKQCDGGNLTRLKKILLKMRFNTSHFSGQSWNKGKKLGHKFPIEDYLKLNGKYITPLKLKIRLIEEGIKKEFCERCKNKIWLKEKIPLELHHKNGNKNDNRLENLEILCPNCHTFTFNFAGKKTSKFSKEERIKYGKIAQKENGAKMSKKLGIPESTLGSWRRQFANN